MKNNVFYQFALKYLDKRAKIIQDKYHDSLNLFIKDFEFSKKDLEDFVKFADSKEVKQNEEEFKKDRDYIIQRLKAQIARNFWKNEGWYSVLLKTDHQMLKAVTLFGEAKDLAKLK